MVVCARRQFIKFIHQKRIHNSPTKILPSMTFKPKKPNTGYLLPILGLHQILNTTCFDSLPPSHSFHGSNSSHSKDNGLVVFWCNEYNLIVPCRSGGRTYHIPNYATRFVLCITVSSWGLKASSSYANERSSVISVSFDENKKTPTIIIAIVIIFLLFAAIPVFLMVYKTPKYMVEIPKGVEGSTSTNLHSGSKERINSVRDNSRQLEFFK